VNRALSARRNDAGFRGAMTGIRREEISKELQQIQIEIS